MDKGVLQPPALVSEGAPLLFTPKGPCSSPAWGWVLPSSWPNLPQLIAQGNSGTLFRTSRYSWMALLPLSDGFTV